MNDPIPVLLIGAGGHAKACIDVIEQTELFSVAGLVGIPEQVGSWVLGYPVLGTDDDLPDLRKKYSHALVSVGQIRTVKPRIRLFELLQQHSFVLPLVISPKAHVSDHATIGAGTIVMHGVVVNAGAVVGCNCILNSQSLIEHDAQIADHCHIATAAVVNGDTSIGARTFIGSGTVLRESITLGEDCVIGMGQRILADCSSGTSMPELRATL